VVGEFGDVRGGKGEVLALGEGCAAEEEGRGSQMSGEKVDSFFNKRGEVVGLSKVLA